MVNLAVCLVSAHGGTPGFGDSQRGRLIMGQRLCQRLSSRETRNVRPLERTVAGSGADSKGRPSSPRPLFSRPFPRPRPSPLPLIGANFAASEFPPPNPSPLSPLPPPPPDRGEGDPVGAVLPFSLFSFSRSGGGRGEKRVGVMRGLGWGTFEAGGGRSEDRQSAPRGLPHQATGAQWPEGRLDSRPPGGSSFQRALSQPPRPSRRQGAGSYTRGVGKSQAPKTQSFGKCPQAISATTARRDL
jgi:hypothetical protein